jgi:Cysteine-rich CPCC
MSGDMGKSSFDSLGPAHVEWRPTAIPEPTPAPPSVYFVSAAFGCCRSLDVKRMADRAHVDVRGVTGYSREGSKFPCPCCGHCVHEDPPGSYMICQVCWWEDDQVQLRWPTWAPGANRVSLVEAQRNYAAAGACEPRASGRARPPREDEPLDAGWRLIDLRIDDFEPQGEATGPWPEDKTVLYWWRPTFWRRTSLSRS